MNTNKQLIDLELMAVHIRVKPFKFILSVFQFIRLGAAVVMPIVIFILGLCFKTGVGKVYAGLTVAWGFIDLNFCD